MKYQLMYCFNRFEHKNVPVCCSKLDLRESTTTCPSSSMETDSDTDDDNDTVSHGLSGKSEIVGEMMQY